MRGMLRLGGLVMACLTSLSLAAPADAATARSGWADELIVDLERPLTTLEPIGPARLLAGSLLGDVYELDATRATGPRLVLDLRGLVCTGGERGLQRVAADPDFATNRVVYVFYTRKRPASGCDAAPKPSNRVSRFTLSADLAATLASEQVLLDEMPQPSTIHNGGDVQFGGDGLLYVTVGDGGCHRVTGQCGSQNPSARELNIPNGKVLRITRDGAVPLDNPYSGPGTARCNAGPVPAGTTCQEIYAHGLRNPFRMAVDASSSTGRIHVNDVGNAQWEEVNLLRRGGDYGWNRVEGRCATACAYDNPIHQYGHSDGCVSIVGGAFIPASAAPPPFAGTYLYGDYGCGKVFRLIPSGSGFTREVFVTGGGPITHLAFAPGVTAGSRSALFYAGTNGEVHRVRYTGTANRAPTARLRVDPPAGGVPLNVQLDGSASTDPDGDPLTYTFDPGDGSPARTGSAAVVAHQYTVRGSYTATLHVTDPLGLVASTTARVDADNALPVIDLVEPAVGTTFAVGQPIAIRARATDAEDGLLAPDALTIEVLRHHDAHTHPFLAPAPGDEASIVGPAPEDLLAARNSHLEVIVSARDSNGGMTTLRRTILPRKRTVYVGANVKATITVNGVGYAPGSSLVSWEGYALDVSAPTRVGLQRFLRWENGSTSTRRTFVTPAHNYGMKATYGL